MDTILEVLRHVASDASYCMATRHGFVKDKAKFKLSFRPLVSGLRVPYDEIPRMFGLKYLKPELDKGL